MVAAPGGAFEGLLQSSRAAIRPKRRTASTRRSGPNAEAVPLSGPLELGRGDAPDVDAAGQARINGGSHEVRPEEGQRDGVCDVPPRAALARRDPIQGRAAEELSQPGTGAAERAQE